MKDNSCPCGSDNMEDDEQFCSLCNGTGEGVADTASCLACSGSGLERPSVDDSASRIDEWERDQAADADSWYEDVYEAEEGGIEVSDSPY